VSFNGTSITDAAQLERLLSDAPIGSTGNVRVIRDGRAMDLRVPIQRRTS
jgi:S1-C subfamily serine protease